MTGTTRRLVWVVSLGVALGAAPLCVAQGGAEASPASPGEKAPEKSAEKSAEERAKERAAWLAERDRMREEGIEFIRTYYTHPDPGAVGTQVANLSKSGFMRTQWTRGIVAGFLIPVARENPDRVSGWLDQWADMQDEHLAGMMYAVWLSQIDGVDEILSAHLPNLDNEWHGAVTDLFDDEPYDVLAVREPEEWQFEMIWGWYGATGDERCLARVLAFTADERYEENYAEAATLSLSYNAATDPTVRAWCERELAKAQAGSADALPEAEQLQGILDDAEFVYENRKTLRLGATGVPH